MRESPLASTLICRGQRLFVVVGADESERCGVFDLRKNSYLWTGDASTRVDVWGSSPDSDRLVGLNWESGLVSIYSAISGELECQFEAISDAAVWCQSSGLILTSDSAVLRSGYDGGQKQECSVQGRVVAVWSSMLMTEWKGQYQLFDLDGNLLGAADKLGLGVLRGTVAESEKHILFGESRGSVRCFDKTGASMKWEYIPPHGWHAAFLATSGNRTFAICPEIATMETAKYLVLSDDGNCLREWRSGYRGLACYCEPINCWITNRLEAVDCSDKPGCDVKAIEQALRVILQ